MIGTGPTVYTYTTPVLRAEHYGVIVELEFEYRGHTVSSETTLLPPGFESMSQWLAQLAEDFEMIEKIYNRLQIIGPKRLAAPTPTQGMELALYEELESVSIKPRSWTADFSDLENVMETSDGGVGLVAMPIALYTPIFGEWVVEGVADISDVDNRIKPVDRDGQGWPMTQVLSNTLAGVPIEMPRPLGIAENLKPESRGKIGQELTIECIVYDQQPVEGLLERDGVVIGAIRTPHQVIPVRQLTQYGLMEAVYISDGFVRCSFTLPFVSKDDVDTFYRWIFKDGKGNIVKTRTTRVDLIKSLRMTKDLHDQTGILVKPVKAGGGLDLSIEFETDRPVKVTYYMDHDAIEVNSRVKKHLHETDDGKKVATLSLQSIKPGINNAVIMIMVSDGRSVVMSRAVRIELTEGILAGPDDMTRRYAQGAIPKFYARFIGEHLTWFVQYEGSKVALKMPSTREMRQGGEVTLAGLILHNPNQNAIIWAQVSENTPPSAKAKLTFEDAPKVLGQIQDAVEPGQPARLMTLVGEGTAPFYYRLFKVQGDGRYVFVAENWEGYFDFAHASLEDNGNYVILVTNDAGFDLSFPMVLTVVEKPCIVVEPTDPVRKIGDMARWKIDDANGKWRQWWILYQGNPKAEKLQGKTGKVLVLEVTEAIRGALVWCEVENEVDKAISHTSQVIIKLPPTIKVDLPQEKFIEEERHLDLWVGFEGDWPLSCDLFTVDPQGVETFRVSKKNLKDTVHFRIEDIRMPDSGNEIYIWIRNIVGEAVTQRMKLNVTEKHIYVKARRDLKVQARVDFLGFAIVMVIMAVLVINWFFESMRKKQPGNG